MLYYPAFLWPLYGIGQAIIFSCCGFYLLSVFFFFLAWSQWPHIGCLPYFDTWCGPSANLECRCETCCAQLAENAGTKKSPKIGHLGTIAQLCRAISLEQRHVSTIGKSLLNSNTSSACPDTMVNLQPTNGWDLLASLRHPCKFQWVSRLGSITARHSSSGRQPNFAAFNRGATYIRQGGHHVGHWPTFLVLI